MITIRFASLALLFVIISACAPAATPTQIAPTPDAKATETRIAGNIYATQTASVPTATNTPQSTDTPRPSDTPPATDTPLPTNTLLPTDTPLPTATLDPVADKKTFNSVDVRDLKKAPEKYRDQKIVLRGEVFTIQEDTSGGTGMQIWVGYPGASSLDRVPVVVQYAKSLPGLYEKQQVIVYGLGGEPSRERMPTAGTLYSRSSLHNTWTMVPRYQPRFRQRRYQYPHPLPRT